MLWIWHRLVVISRRAGKKIRQTGVMSCTLLFVLAGFNGITLLYFTSLRSYVHITGISLIHSNFMLFMLLILLIVNIYSAKSICLPGF